MTAPPTDAFGVKIGSWTVVSLAFKLCLPHLLKIRFEYFMGGTSAVESTSVMIVSSSARGPYEHLMIILAASHYPGSSPSVSTTVTPNEMFFIVSEGVDP